MKWHIVKFTYQNNTYIKFMKLEIIIPDLLYKDLCTQVDIEQVFTFVKYNT